MGGNTTHPRTKPLSLQNRFDALSNGPLRHQNNQGLKFKNRETRILSKEYIPQLGKNGVLTDDCSPNGPQGFCDVSPASVLQLFVSVGIEETGQNNNPQIAYPQNAGAFALQAHSDSVVTPQEIADLKAFLTRDCTTLAYKPMFNTLTKPDFAFMKSSFVFGKFVITLTKLNLPTYFLENLPSAIENACTPNAPSSVQTPHLDYSGAVIAGGLFSGLLVISAIACDIGLRNGETCTAQWQKSWTRWILVRPFEYLYEKSTGQKAQESIPLIPK